MYADAFFRKHSDNNYLLRIIEESSGKTENNFLIVMDYHKRISNTIGNAPFKTFYKRENGNIIFVQPFMDHIIEITEKGVSSLIEFIGKDVLTIEETKIVNESYSFDKNKNMSNLFRYNKYFTISSFIEKGENIFFEMKKGNTFHAFLIHKETNEVSIFEKYFDDVLLRKK